MNDYTDGLPSSSAFLTTSYRDIHPSRVTVFDELNPLLTPDAAYTEALRCLECGSEDAPAPCTVACPSDIDVAGFIAALARNDPRHAAEIIMSENPLGGTCARVCPTEELCEGACVLEERGRRPVSVGRLQRYATDKVLLSEGHGETRPLPEAKSGRVAVIGAGPAGLACAAQLAQQGYRVTVYEARSEPGGLVRFAIAPYRIMKTPLTEEMARIAQMGVTFRFNYPITCKEDLETIEKNADAVFLGVGLGNDINAGYPGSQLPGVWASLQFIEHIKTGRIPSVGNRVAVIGGGNTAIDVAREAKRMGSQEVTIVYRRTESEMPAYRAETEAARMEGIRFLWLTVPLRFLGHDRLQSIECRYARLGSPDESGRRYPEPIEGSEFEIEVDTAVLAAGQQPRREWVEWVPGLTMSGKHIRVNPHTGQTSHPKFFAGGDAVNGGTTVVQAVREGKIAAVGIQHFLELSDEPTIDDSQTSSVSQTSSAPAPLSPTMLYKQHEDVILAVNRSWCKGCNICVEYCPTSILALDDSQLVYVTDISRCIACGICAVFCPDFVFSLNVADTIAPVALWAGGIRQNSGLAD